MEVVLTDRAFKQMEAAYAWWSQNRSAEQAARWYSAFADAMQSLSQNPDRCALSLESGAFPFELHFLTSFHADVAD